MITVGIIKEKYYDKETLIYKVDLSIFKSPGVKESNITTTIIEATACVAPGTYEPFNIEDLVYVGFINNELGQPVILGKIAQRLDEETDASSLNRINSLVVTNNVILPEDIKIGNITYEDLVKIKTYVDLNMDNTGPDLSAYLKNKGGLFPPTEYSGDTNPYFNSEIFYDTSLDESGTLNINFYKSYYKQINNEWQIYNEFDGNIKLKKDSILINNEKVITENTLSKNLNTISIKGKLDKGKSYGTVYWAEANFNSLPSSFNVTNVWTDGNNIYYANNYMLDKNTLTWNTIYNDSSSYPKQPLQCELYYRFNYKNNLYCSKYNIDKVLKQDSYNWEDCNWKSAYALEGRYVWSDTSNNIYYLNNVQSNTNVKAQLHFNKDINEWEADTLATSSQNISGAYIWKSADNVYYSSGSTQYVFDESTKTWSNKSWSGSPLTSFYGNYIWNSGGVAFYSYGSNQYYFNNFDQQWVAITWENLANFNGNNVWEYNGNIYYSSDSQQYILDTNMMKADAIISNMNVNGNLIWSDGEYVYYSNQTSHYQGTFSNPTYIKWEEIIFGISFYGNDVYYVDNDIYLANGLFNYKFNKVTKQWEIIDFANVIPLDGDMIWSDGDDLYFSYDYYQKKYNYEENKWENITWNGDNYPYRGNAIWTDGKDIYYLNQYILDKKSKMWLNKDWGQDFPNLTSAQLLNFNHYLWCDGDYLYYSNSSTQYIFIDGSWKQMVWVNQRASSSSSTSINKLSSFYGYNIWTDGEHIYCYYNSTSNYILKKSSVKSIVPTLGNLYKY